MNTFEKLLAELLRCDEITKDSPNPTEIKKQIVWSLQFGAILEANRSGVFSIDNLAGLPAHLHDWPTAMNYLEQATGIDARKSEELVAALRKLHTQGDMRAKQSDEPVEAPIPSNKASRRKALPKMLADQLAKEGTITKAVKETAKQWGMSPATIWNDRRFIKNNTRSKPIL